MGMFQPRDKQRFCFEAADEVRMVGVLGQNDLDGDFALDDGKTVLGQVIEREEIVAPLMVKAGYDPIWFGVMIVILMETAMITPPVGISLLVACSVGRVSPSEVARPLFPYLAVLLLEAMPIFARFEGLHRRFPLLAEKMNRLHRIKHRVKP